jgi:PhnB protein
MGTPVLKPASILKIKGIYWRIQPLILPFLHPLKNNEGMYFCNTIKRHIMTQINAYLNFDGNCRQVMEFYKTCLGGDLMLQTVGGSPVEAQCPAGMKDQILHASLTKGSLNLMGSDMSGPEGIIKGNNIALSLNCSSEEEINNFFSSLSAGGKIIDSLKTQFWGAIFGVFVDQFGIRWMLNYDKSQKS